MLRVIEAREAGDDPQIVPTINQDVLLVAKVRRLEEEWADKYDELYADPRALLPVVYPPPRRCASSFSLAAWLSRFSRGAEIRTRDLQSPRLAR